MDCFLTQYIIRNNKVIYSCHQCKYCTDFNMEFKRLGFEDIKHNQHISWSLRNYSYSNLKTEEERYHHRKEHTPSESSLQSAVSFFFPRCGNSFQPWCHTILADKVTLLVRNGSSQTDAGKPLQQDIQVVPLFERYELKMWQKDKWALSIMLVSINVPVSSMVQLSSGHEFRKS